MDLIEVGVERAQKNLLHEREISYFFEVAVMVMAMVVVVAVVIGSSGPKLRWRWWSWRK